MTWRRYFSARLGRYRCPHCGRVSRLKKRVPWLTETIAVLIAMVPAVAAHHCLLAESGTIGVVVYSFVVFLVAIPRDRYFDHRFGRLTRPPEKGGN